MLVLKRNVGETVILDCGGFTITVMVCEAWKGNNVGRVGNMRLGFEAPDHVRIMRSELLGREDRDDSVETKSMGGDM